MNDKIFKKNGSEYITKKISESLVASERSATVTGKWEIETEIRIPSNFTLFLDGCHLKMADGVYSNMFVNENHDTVIGRTTGGTDHNISIIGKNGAILDGGKYNGLSEKTQLQYGLPPVYKNNLLLFTNVDDFEICGISCRNQRWWALNFIYCSRGRLHDINFEACDIGIDETGNEYHGLRRGKYDEVLVKNADGIDLRQGSHDIAIENITGFTEDDSIALTGLNGILEKTFAVEGLSKDICNITIKNIATSAFCTNVRLLNQGGIKLHDIFIDGVHDTSEGSRHMDRGIYTVRIGDTHLYDFRHATAEETYNITVRNIRSRGTIAAVGLAGNMENLVIENIECYDGTQELEDKRCI